MQMQEWFINFFAAGFQSALSQILIKQEEFFQMIAEKIALLTAEIAEGKATVDQLKQVILEENQQVNDAVSTLTAVVDTQQQTIADLMAQLDAGSINLDQALASATELNASVNDAIAAVGNIYNQPEAPVEETPVEEPQPETPVDEVAEPEEVV